MEFCFISVYYKFMNSILRQTEKSKVKCSLHFVYTAFSKVTSATVYNSVVYVHWLKMVLHFCTLCKGRENEKPHDWYMTVSLSCRVLEWSTWQLRWLSLPPLWAWVSMGIFVWKEHQELGWLEEPWWQYCLERSCKILYQLFFSIHPCVI